MQEDIFGDTVCRLCAHWTGDVEHVRQQVPSFCKLRHRLHPQPRTYADDTCPSFQDAGRDKGARVA